MKRKIIILVLAACLLIGAAIGLAFCNKTCAHSYSDWTRSKAATCTENGEETRTCTKCENTETRTIDALGHNFSESGTTDENGHYHACLRENCDARSTYAEIDKNNDYACDVCSENLLVKLKTDLAALVGDGTQDSVTVTLNLIKSADSTVFSTIVEGLANAKEGSIKLTISGVETIPDEAFKSCYALGSVTLGDGVKKIDKNAFADARYITDLILGDDVTDIGEYAFSACYRLLNVTIGKTVENIGESAFVNAAIKSIVIPDSVKTLGTYAFGYCSSLAEIVLSENITTLSTNVFYATAIKSLTIPDGVTTLENLAFQNCVKLESIVIPDSVISIGDELFLGAKALKSVTFGKGVTKLGGNLFYYCSSLTEITFLSPISEVAGNAFYDEKAYVPELNPTTENVTLNFTNEQKVLAQNGDGKWVATETNFSDGNEFCGSTFKKIVVSPTEINALQTSTEDLQAKIAELIAAGTTNISVKLAVNAGSDVFSAIKNGIASAKDGSVNLTICGAETIPQSAFEECMQIKSITLGEGVKTIGEKAFAAALSLVSVDIGADVESIGTFAFTFTAITEINIPDTVTTIEGYAFYYCQSLASVTLGKGISTIPDRVFYMCTSLKSITIPSNITTVESAAFTGSGLTSIVIPDTVTSLGAAAFSNCKALSSVTIGSGIKSIGSQTFNDCEALKSITIPSTVESIGEFAFSGTALTSVTVPDSVTSLGENAFGACESLTSITIGKGVTDMSKNVFNGNVTLTEIIFRGVLTEADELIFHKLTTANVTLTLATGQKVLAKNVDDKWVATETNFSDGNEFCGSTFKNIVGEPTKINALQMSASDLQTALENYVSNGTISFEITLPEDADKINEKVWTSDFFEAIKNGLANASEKSVILVLKGDITSIPDEALRESKWIKSISIPDSVTRIGVRAFYSTTLETIKFGENSALTSIDKWAFDACSNLSGIIFPKGVTSIGPSAFSDCTSLVNVTLPDNLETIKQDLFYNCVKLESVTIGKNVKIIELRAFDDCTSLKDITIPKSVTNLGFCVFGNCKSLTSIKYEGTKEEWNAITKTDKSGSWDVLLKSSEVVCSDGTITL